MHHVPARYTTGSTPPSAGQARRAGMTLLEVVIVITVLAIVAVLALPMLAPAQQDRLRAAARMLAADLEYAQVDSITHPDDPRLVRFDLDGHAYHLAPASDPETPILDPARQQPYHTRFGQGRAGHLPDVRFVELDIDQLDDDIGTLAFGPLGQLQQDQPAGITLAAGEHRIELTVDPASGETDVGNVQ